MPSLCNSSTSCDTLVKGNLPSWIIGPVGLGRAGSSQLQDNRALATGLTGYVFRASFGQAGT